MRWPVLASLLLPLPFAALPLIALVMTDSGSGATAPPAGDTRVVLTSVTLTADDIALTPAASVASSELEPCGNDHSSTLRQGT